MEPEGSLQESTTRPYLEPDESSSHTHSLLLGYVIFLRDFL